MSIYYYLVCHDCKQLQPGLIASHQAWGWGNMDIISTFKFAALHHHHSMSLISENDQEFEDYEQPAMQEFIEASHGMMPHSNDWSIVSDNEWTDAEWLWEEANGDA